MVNYIDKNAYFTDMKIIDERLNNLEHTVDQITKNIVELLNAVNKPSKKKVIRYKPADKYVELAKQRVQKILEDTL